MIKEITQYVENNSDFEIDTDLFAGFAPSSVKGDQDQVILIESGGAPDFDLPDASARTLQVLSKSKDYHTARDNAFEIKGLLHRACGITLPEVVSGTVYYVNTAQALTDPQSLGQDENGRFVFSTNYVLRMQDAE